MATPPPSMRDLARRLLDAERAKLPASTAFEAQAAEAVRVCDKLRVSLTRFAGADGFTSLLRRAVALAQEEFSALLVVTVNSDGSLEGLEQLGASTPAAPGSGSNPATEAAIAITANLLGLLVIFIGQSLTLRLVREAWPDAPLEELQ